MTSALLQCFFIYITIIFVKSSNTKDINIPVTYGSSVFLQHISTGYRLFSARVEWTHGTAHQITTLIRQHKYDENCLWTIKPRHEIFVSKSFHSLKTFEDGGTFDKPDFYTGSAVTCGDIITLEHTETERNLHSHMHKSHLSPGYEVSGFGSRGVGDEGDNFKVQCLKPGANVWHTGEPVAFQHVQIGNYVVASAAAKFTHNNCPRCPIVGHLEVSVQLDRSTHAGTHKWEAIGSLMLERHEEEDEAQATRQREKDEL